MATRVGVDADPLLHFGQADALFLLKEFEQVHVPQTALDEIYDAEPLAALTDLDRNVRRVDHSTDDYPAIDPGETAAIIFASVIRVILLTDDLAAREVVNEADIEVHGSLGIVLFAH